MYLYQYEEKKPFYFLFKFGNEDEIGDIEWIEGDLNWVNEVIDNDKISLKIADVTQSGNQGANSVSKVHKNENKGVELTE